MNSLAALARTARRLQATSLLKPGATAKRLPALLFFTDPARVACPDAVVARLPRGAGVVFRAFGAADALAQGRRLTAVARRRGVMVFVGADVSLAIALKADGVHLPQALAGRTGDNRAIRRRFRLTAAAHDASAILAIGRSGVEALIVSPVFPSRSPSAGRPLGVLAFARLVRNARTPVFAMGGIDALAARRLARSGATGLAAVEALTKT